MRRTLLFLLAVTLVGCMSVPSYQLVAGGQRVDQPGVSFVLPEGHKWAAIMRSTYQCAFGAVDMPKNDTLIVGCNVYSIQPASSKEDFLKEVHDARMREPSTGRFERIRNTEQLYDGRSETCVIYRSASKDFGAEAKRGGEYSVLETIGMHCVHPSKPAVGIQVELSRKAPPDTSYSNIDGEGVALLKSVTFGAF